MRLSLLLQVLLVVHLIREETSRRWRHAILENAVAHGSLNDLTQLTLTKLTAFATTRCR